MSRKVLHLIVAIFGIAGLLAVACSSPAPTPTPAPAPKPTTTAPAPSPTAKPTTTVPAPSPTAKPTTAPAPAAKPVELKFSSWAAPTISQSKAQIWFFDEIAKRTEGRVKVVPYWSESLVPRAEHMDALSSGIVDMAIFLPTHYPAKLPVLSVTSMWTYLTPSFWVASKAYADYSSTFAPARDELAKYKSRYLAPSTGTPNYIFSTKPIKNLTDLKSLKIRATELEAIALRSFGAVPVALGPVEVTEAMSRGTLDGASQTIPGAGGYSYHEPAKYVYRLPLSGNVFGIAITDKAWNSISKADQDTILKAADEHHAAYYRIYVQEGEADWLKKMKDAGVTFTDPSPADMAEYQKLVNDTILKDWVKDKESKGLPGQAAMDAFKSLVKKYEPLNPFK